MLVVMKAHASEEQIRAVCEKIESLGYRAHAIPGAQRTAIGITGNRGTVEPGAIEEMSGVHEVIRVSKPYKLVSRDAKEEDTVVRFSGSDGSFGGRDLGMVAGPCAIESPEQAFAVAERIAKAGARFFRGGAYKPRTSPYAFQGLGLEALKIMAEIRTRYGLRIVTEAIDHESLELVAEYADMIQIGARNMQNFSLLRQEAGTAQTRHVGHAGRISHGRRIHSERRQLRGGLVRAGRSHFCRPYAQHPRPEHCSGGTTIEPPAHRGRSQPWNRKTQ